MNVITELWIGMPLGSYSATRGWDAEQIAAAAEDLRAEGVLDGDELSARGREWRDGLEVTTDAMERPVVDAISAGPATASMPSLRSSKSGPPAASRPAPSRLTHSSAPPAERARKWSTGEAPSLSGSAESG